MSEKDPQLVPEPDDFVSRVVILGIFAVPIIFVLVSALGAAGLLAVLLFGGLGWFLGTRSPEAKSVMFGALGGLLIWSAVSYAAWQLYLWNLGREMERAWNQ
jgi:hypothetical protein